MDKPVSIKGKEALRKEILYHRRGLTPLLIEQLSSKINKKIINHPKFITARNIMIYIPIKNEVDIKEVIEYSWRENKQILATKTNMDTNEMEVYLIKSWQDLELGNYQIYEPRITDKSAFSIEQIELVLVPGVAFDKNLNRLGFGGGYYDRFFDQFNQSPYKIGIGYDFQLISNIPVDGHDYRMNEVITESYNIKN